MSNVDRETLPISLTNLLTDTQKRFLRAAWEWWQEGDRALEYLADKERQTALAARLRPLLTELKASPTAERVGPILRWARSLTANRALTRTLETDSFAAALRDLLDEATPLPERLANFLQTPGVGPLIASHLLYAAAPERFPFVSPPTLAALNPSRDQRKAARDIARKRYEIEDSPENPTDTETFSLLTDFALYDAARRELALADYLELNAVLWRAREMPKRGGRGAGKATGGKGQGKVKEERAGYVSVAPVAPVAEATESDLLAYIEGYVVGQGFTFPALVVRDYYVALKAKPFVILSGLSGTGKTRLTRLFADALTGGGTASAGQYLLLPVRPDWTDSAALLGYHNLLTDRYVSTPFLDLLRRAAAPENRERAFFLCLDEMNLARVEHYFAELLSAMETPDPKQITLPDGRPAPLPSNVFLTGSVNMDEATHPFSRKVLDRANLIEFSEVQLTASPSNTQRVIPSTTPLWRPNAYADLRPDQCQQLFLMNGVPTFAAAQERLNAIHPAFAERAFFVLSALNEKLEARSLHFGYRVRDEVLRYLAASFAASGVGLLDSDPSQNLAIALDLQIVQKVLPRLSGTTEALEPLLKYLEEWAAAEGFPRAAAKLSRIRRRAAEEGIVTFYEF